MAFKTCSKLIDRFRSPCPAMPVDLFRILVGALTLAWNINNYLDVQDISSPDGLIDHKLAFEIFWFAKIGFFQVGLPQIFFQMIFAVAGFLSLGLILGVRPRICATILFFAALSTYRWNLPVMFVDDAFIHLMLFWLILMPQGSTLNFFEWKRNPKASWESWKKTEVPGLAVRAFLFNIALLYLVTGLWKWTSDYWQSGFALYATLKLPISWASTFWQPGHLPFLKILTWTTMVIEPLLALMFFLPPKHKLKYFLGFSAVCLHLGIILTIKVPLANLGCLGALILVFRYEIMDLMRGKKFEQQTATPSPITWRDRLALLAITLIMLSTLRGIPIVGEVHKPAYAALWCMGLIQEYHLFDWIDRVNSHVEYEVRFKPATGPMQNITHQLIFPTHVRSMLLQSYLHNVVWMPVPVADRKKFKASIFQRFANRYAANNPSEGIVIVEVQRQRITPDNMELSLSKRELFLMFTIKNGVARIHRSAMNNKRVDNAKH